MKGKDIVTLLICLTIPLVIGSISGILTAGNITTWYVTLNKPGFNPPNYLFGPVWTLLYLLMGVSLYFVWQAPASVDKRNALVIFAIQLALNFAWSFLFFEFKQLGVALVEILLLWACILATIVLFSRINKTAAYLQIPYLLWVSFATLLNFSIWQLN